MSWIKTISDEDASGKLKNIYKKIKSPDGQIDNVLSIHSLRPHTLTGHMSLYKNVLHHADNTFENWFLELVGAYTSFLNECLYCYEHHFAGMKRFLNDDKRSEKIRAFLEQHLLHNVLNEKETAIIEYAKKLTTSPAEITEENISYLRENGLNDGEILEINQVVAYFNYANRTVLGLGVNTLGEKHLGLSPKSQESEDAWEHEY